MGCAVLRFPSLGCLVSGCTLAGWKSEYLLVRPGRVNLVSKFCASRCCFLIFPSLINKSSHPSIFGWNEIDPGAARRCQRGRGSAWHKYCVRGSSRWGIHCPAEAINICSSDYSCSFDLPGWFLYNLIFFKQTYVLSVVLLHFPWIFLESHCRWSSCDWQEKWTHSSKENANSSLSALFSADSHKISLHIAHYFFVIAVSQLPSGFLFPVWQNPSCSFSCRNQMQKSCVTCSSSAAPVHLCPGDRGTQGSASLVTWQPPLALRFDLFLAWFSCV